MARTTATKKAPARARSTPRATRATRTPRRPASTSHQRLYLAADIAAATLAGYREGHAAAIAATAIATTLDASSSTPIKILADGTHCAPGDTRTDHVAVLLPAEGLMFTRRPVNDAKRPQTALEEECQRIDIAGFRDWRMPELDELQLIIDRTCHLPALDTHYFSDVPDAWLWTATGCAWQEKDAAGRSPSAWFVLASYGIVSDGHRSCGGFALAVRRWTAYR